MPEARVVVQYERYDLTPFPYSSAVFRPEKPIATKLQFIFNLFDYNMDDTLDPEELAEMITIVSASAKAVSRGRCALHLDTVPKHILVVGRGRHTTAGQSKIA